MTPDRPNLIALPKPEIEEPVEQEWQLGKWHAPFAQISENEFLNGKSVTYSNPDSSFIVIASIVKPEVPATIGRDKTPFRHLRMQILKQNKHEYVCITQVRTWNMECEGLANTELQEGAITFDQWGQKGQDVYGNDSITQESNPLNLTYKDIVQTYVALATVPEARQLELPLSA